MSLFEQSLLKIGVELADYKYALACFAEHDDLMIAHNAGINLKVYGDEFISGISHDEIIERYQNV